MQLFEVGTQFAIDSGYFKPASAIIGDRDGSDGPSGGLR